MKDSASWQPLGFLLTSKSGNRRFFIRLGTDEGKKPQLEIPNLHIATCTSVSGASIRHKIQNHTQNWCPKAVPCCSDVNIEDLLPFGAWMLLQRRIYKTRINISSFTKHKVQVCRGAVCICLLFAAKPAVTSGSPRHFPPRAAPRPRRTTVGAGMAGMWWL